MVSFGLIGDWTPKPGVVTTWKPTSESIAQVHAAPPHPVPPSHIQEEYLKSAHRNRDSGFRFSRLCLVTFDIYETLPKENVNREPMNCRYDDQIAIYGQEVQAKLGKLSNTALDGRRANGARARRIPGPAP